MKDSAAGWSRSVVRRRFLLRMAAGVAGGVSGLLQQALAAESTTVAPGIRSVRGTVFVNGERARVGTVVPEGATVITESNSEITYVVGRDAYLQRAGTHVLVGRAMASVFRVVTGALLAVFATGTQRTIATSVITAGIRGTGCYVEVEEKRTYFCLCYGTVDLAPTSGRMRTYTTGHHDSPYWIDEAGTVTAAEMRKPRRYGARLAGEPRRTAGAVYAAIYKIEERTLKPAHVQGRNPRPLKPVLT